MCVMQVKADGTVHGAAGTSVASSNAVANPLLNVLTRGAFDNRPKAASSAYTQIPLALREYLTMLCHTHCDCVTESHSVLWSPCEV